MLFCDPPNRCSLDSFPSRQIASPTPPTPVFPTTTPLSEATPLPAHLLKCEPWPVCRGVFRQLWLFNRVATIWVRAPTSLTWPPPPLPARVRPLLAPPLSRVLPALRRGLPPGCAGADACACAVAQVVAAPMLVASLAMMFGNWAQHLFLDPARPRSNYALT